MRHRRSFVTGICSLALAAVAAASAGASAAPDPIRPIGFPTVLVTSQPLPEQRARPLPPGAGAQSGRLLERIGLTRVSGLRFTTNEATCLARGGDTISCETVRTHNAVAISWAAGAACPSCTIKGYRVRAAAPQPGPILDASTTPIAVEQAPPGGWAGQCFVVSSYSEPVVPMVNDGTGHKIPLPGATPAGTHAESPPSEPLCIDATRADLVLLPVATRSYRRTDFINYLTDGKEHVRDDPPYASNAPQIGNEYLKNKQDSQTNIFYRTAVAFDPKPIGRATVFGGAFAFDATVPRTGQCLAVTTPAPGDWETASWIAATGNYLPALQRSGNLTFRSPIDAAVRSWPPGKIATYVIGGAESAEFVKAGVEGHQFSCSGTVTNVRLIVSVGVDR